MGNSKIIYGDTTLIDLTSDTVNANNLLKGATAHGANGEAITGAADMDNLVPNSGNTAIVDSDVIVTKQASDSNWYQKTFSLIWNYIKGKIGISAQGSTGKYLDEQGNFTTPPGSAVVSKTANGLAPQLPNETSTDKYLRQDGTWAVPPDTIGTYDSTARSNASSALSNEAPSYSSSTAYSVGQFVMYNNTTYECIKATSAGTAPTNTTYWKENKLGTKLTELNSALNNIGIVVDGTIRTGITVSVGTKGHVGTITLPKGKWFVFSMIRADQTTGGQLWFGDELTGFSGSSQQNGFGVFGASVKTVNAQTDLLVSVYNNGPQTINPAMGYIKAFRIG